MKSIKSNTALPVTGTVRSISREKHHQRLDLETFQKERQSRKLFFKIFQGQLSNQLFKMILIVRRLYGVGNPVLLLPSPMTNKWFQEFYTVFSLYDFRFVWLVVSKISIFYNFSFLNICHLKILSFFWLFYCCFCLVS